MIIGIVFASTMLTITALVISQKIFIRRNITDKINQRSSHSVTATRNGGIAVFTTIFCISAFYYLNGIDLFNYSFLVPLSILLVVGCYDDVYNVDFKLKFIFQIIAAKILIDNGLIIENLHGMFGINALNRIVAQLLTMFVIISIINAINFIDGTDGLAISVVSFFIILFEMLSLDSSTYSILSIILIASFIPMLYYNFRKNHKIFLGDSGSLFLGGIISIYVLHILSSEYIIKNEFDLNKILYIFSILMYPIVDIIRVVLIRLTKGKSPFKADRSHIHHILLDKYQSHATVIFIILGFSIVNLIILQLLF